MMHQRYYFRYLKWRIIPCPLCFQTADDHLNVLYHPEHFKGPILFSFRSKVFFGKKKAMIRVEDGEWSDKFSIDVAGSEGVVACKYNGMIYQVFAIDFSILKYIIKMYKNIVNTRKDYNYTNYLIKERKK